MERAAKAEAAQAVPVVEEEEDSGSETEREEDYRTTVSRPKGESAEDRKARKASVKAERSVRRISFSHMSYQMPDADGQARRAEKKASTTTFSTERKKQLDSHKKLVSNGRAADMAAGTRGVISLS